MGPVNRRNSLSTGAGQHRLMLCVNTRGLLPDMISMKSPSFKMLAEIFKEHLPHRSNTIAVGSQPVMICSEAARFELWALFSVMALTSPRAGS